ncbi:WG repeat-containing protein [Aquimarina sp. 2304DJ70-9]|uniref:WG repeat-containing protein n=1 Tax=Aquimarina penaris TaxID=3231044 RepID=UPI003461C1F6
MKSILIVTTMLMMLPFMGSSQSIEDIDEVTSFHEELAAIRKAEKWAFINTKGDIVIDYREDLVKPKTDASIPYPYFSDGRCLIKKMKDGILYYGYMDTTGKTVIEPQYLSAIPFHKGHAIVLKIVKEELGKNDLLDKNVVSYSYDEVVIDPKGAIKAHLAGPEHLIFTKEKLKKRPTIQSYFLSPNLIVAKTKSKHWKIYALDTSSN